MNEKTCRLLEFDRIKEHIAAYAKSDEAAALLTGQEPETDAEKLALLNSEVAHIITRLGSGDSEPQLRLPVLGDILPKLALDRAALSAEEALALGSFLEEGTRIAKWLATPDYAVPDYLPFVMITDAVFAVISRDGTVRDLPEIKRIKGRIAALQREVQRIAASFARNGATRAMLQAELPSIRDGRTVIAVKANFRGRIRGIVHEVSASGQTLFLEPEAVIEKNNDLFIEERALAAEILRVLRELTAKIAPNRAEIEDFYQWLLRTETLRARAHHASTEHGIFAKPLPARRGFKLLKARHPLLGTQAVPIDIVMREDIRALILTGPNTGGKTAALKTAGLFALMHQCGFALPAEQAELPVFDNIFADIGDEQSLSGALSTFSAHIQNTALIEKNATEHSLVLLDELGAGTGAEEGGALAMALLDAFIEKGSLLFVTTHTGALKNYGWTRPFVENASMEFDGHTRLPTYRVLMGVPGESRAIPIAEQNGIPAAIIERARRYFEHGDSDSAKLITGLQEKIARAAEEKKCLDEERLAFTKEKNRFAERELRLREREIAVKSGEVGKLRALLSESRRKLENLVRAIQEHDGALDRAKKLQVKQFLSELEACVLTEEARLDTESAELAEDQGGTAEISEPLAPSSIRIGMSILAGPLRRAGTVKRQGKRGFWIIETGSVSLPFPEQELFAARKEPAVRPPLITDIDLVSREPAKIELDLRGMRLNEALDLLRHQLDSALAANMPGFAVIHGTGDGILQRGVHDFFKAEACVADYYFSRPELGGAGRTEVTLR